MRILSRTVIVLSVVSLLADIASEMLYPVIPVYLKEIGFSMAGIGVLEGIANFTAGISKGYFGKLSDERGLRLPFVKWGYFLSGISKPLLALMVYPVWIFFVRTLDRLGKGVRTAARDAILSKEATPATKARVFGFHRSLDTIGATLGPILALWFLYLHPGQYKQIFLFAIIPGAVALALLYILKEKKAPESTMAKGNFFSFFKYIRVASPDFKKLVAGLLLFALFNSSDFFLLIKAKEVTGNDSMTIIVYIFYNFMFAALAYPMGLLADKFSLKKIFLVGLLLFTIVYAGFALTSSTVIVFALFALYGIYAAATEGIAKAWISNLAQGKNTATAIGFYTSCESICTLFASILAGIIWTEFGSFYCFLSTAIISFLVSLYFLLKIRDK